MSVTVRVCAALLSPVRRVALLFAALLGGVPAAHAGDIVITAGYLDMRSSGGATVVLVGDRGFSLQGGVAVNGGISDPMQVCNYLHGSCSPGDTVGITGLWSSTDAPGVFSLDGVTYDNRNMASTRLAFYGSFVLPPLSPTAVVTVPFRFDGTATYSRVYTEPAVRENLFGSGVATISLVPESQIPNRWRATRVLYEFGGRVPAPWVSADIGAVTTAGSASHLRDSFVLNGDGADIWGTADAFHFVQQTLPGAGTIVARVLAQTKTHRFAKAGIMLRGSTAASSPSAILDVKPDGGIEFMVRYADAEPTIFVGGAEVDGAQVWLKLTRTSASQVVASYSLDGVSWNEMAAATTPLALPDVLVGLVVTSHDPANLNTALFDQVSVAGAQVTGNFLSEGDFEGYVPPALGTPGWVSDDGLRQVPAKSETNQPHSGAKNGACWTPEYLDCGIYQEVIARTTGTYAFSVYATADRTGGLIGANVNGVTVNLSEVEAHGFGNYAPYTLRFDASAGDVIRVWMYSPAKPGYVVIDDAGLTVQ